MRDFVFFKKPNFIDYLEFEIPNFWIFTFFQAFHIKLEPFLSTRGLRV